MTYQDELNAEARRAVEDNARHFSASLFMLLAQRHPEATDEQLNEAVGQAL